MYRIIKLSLLITVSILMFGCKKDSNDIIPDEQNPTDEPTQKSLTISFEYGVSVPGVGKNIYVIWARNTSSSFIQNIAVCQRLLNGSLTGTALPYWQTSVKPNSESDEIDAVTGATKSNTDFTVSIDLKDNTVREFTLFFETDRSFNDNDWFSDQPALLYSADINLDDNTSEYELTPVAWCPNENTENDIPNTPMGTLQNEMRYITHHKNGSSFGAADEKACTKMVGKITVTVN